jgi:tetratricopeptide (TPR) repeat protein
MKLVDWHPEALIDKHHEGALSNAERTELDDHLARCSACRFELMVADDLDAEAEAGDDDVSHLVRVAVAEAPARTTARRGGVWLLFAAAVLVAGSAAALYGGASSDASSPTGEPADESPTSTTPAVHAPPQPEAAPRDEATKPGDHDAEPNDAVRNETEPNEATTPSAAATAAKPATESASSLFASANAARRAGDRARALALYRQLQTQHPTSPEAKTSQATVGRMLLDGDADAALDHFDKYLDDDGGQLDEEAMLGRAVALQKLGKTAEERAAWQALVARYPASIHAARAKARLAALARGK